MKVRMKARITGTRNGVAWPAPGETIVLPDDEGARMCARGYADPVAEPVKSEKRPSSPESVETRAPKARKPQKRG